MAVIEPAATVMTRGWSRRILRAAALGALLIPAAFVQADDRAASGIWVYGDDDGLLVVHPIATVRAAVDDDTHLSARYEADVISAATVDVRTAASPRGFEETRHGFGLGADRALSRTAVVSSGYGFSYSPDYVTHSGGLELAIEDEGRNRSCRVGVAAASDLVGRKGELPWVGTLTTVGLSLAYASLLSSRLVVDAGLATEWQHGYLENPYRYVPIFAAVGDQPSVGVAESVPDARLRSAVSGRLRWAATDAWFLRASYRFHFDDWGVAGHTFRTELAFEPDPNWTFTLHGQFYGQRAASFYEGRYATLPTVPAFRTLDRELARGVQFTGGARTEYAVGRIYDAELRFDLRGEVTRQRYFDTPRLPERTAVTVGLGVVLER